MKKIITLTGHKHCGKYLVACKLADNSDVAFIKPYTDKETSPSDGEDFDFHYVSKDTLDDLIERETVLSSTTINGNRYVFFECQLEKPYNVLIADDYAVVDIQDKFKQNVYSIKVWNEMQVESERVGKYLYNHEFDEVFHYGVDDIDELIWRIEYDFD